jgi:acetate kinase
MTDLVLTLNGGSSSLKFAAYDADTALRVLQGEFGGLGRPNASFRTQIGDLPPRSDPLGLLDHGAAARHLLKWLAGGESSIRAIGHRLVHGGTEHHLPAVIDPQLLTQLQALSAIAPAHLPAELAIIEICREHFPGLMQVACFDTAFHRTMPAVARRLPIPRHISLKGIERFGFHGLSYAYIVGELARHAGPQVASGRLVLAHLGNGASLAAVNQQQSIETTMGFSTSGGIPMATRSGDLDPGLAHHLAQTEGMDAKAFNDMVNSASGLLGMSETSGDVRDLLAREATDHRASEALETYCYRICQAIGALAASLGGIDTLVFTGGVGEHAPAIRSRACARLGFLGIALDETANAQNQGVISTSASPVTVRVMKTDEEAMIFGLVQHMLAAGTASQEPNTHD